MAKKNTFSLDLSDDQEELRAFVREFGEKFIKPHAAEWDEKEDVPHSIIKQAAKAGIYELEFIATAALDPTGQSMMIILEELARADAGICMAIIGSCLGVTGIMANGTDEQKGKWLPLCFGTEDKPALAAFCVTEPDSGSDVSSLSTTAVYKPKIDKETGEDVGGEWVLNGTKTFITNGGIADVHVVVASVDKSLKGKGQASFVIGPNTKGVSQGSKFKKMGIRASHTAEVVLNNVRIPHDQLLGGKKALDDRLEAARAQKKSGAQPAMATFQMSRPAVGAMAIGIAQAAFDEALKFSLERQQFGKVIAEHQTIAFKLATMETQIEAARLLVRKAAWMAATGKPFTKGEASQAKLAAGIAAVEVATDALLICGGAGYVRDMPMERYVRDAMIFRIFEGTDEIQKIVIARALTGKRIQ